MSTLPLTAEDLRVIATTLEAFEKVITTDIDGEEGGTLGIIGNVEVRDPNDFSKVIGHFVSVDDWYGFRPKADA